MAKANEKKLLQNAEERKMLIAQLGADLGDILQPILAEMARNSRLNAEDLKAAMSNIKISTPMEPNITVNVPEIQVPEANVSVDIPEIKVPAPIVNYTPPPIIIPDFPKKMDIEGWMGLMGYDSKMLANPLPVQLRDKDGKPLNLFEGLTTLITGGGGNAAFRHVVVDRMPDVTIGAVQQASGAVDSVNVVSSITLDTHQLSGSEDSVVVNNTVDVKQVSGSEHSVIVNNVLVSLETKQVSGFEYSVVVNNTLDVKQVSGSQDSVVINSTLVSLDVKQMSGDVSSVIVNDTLKALDVVQVSGAVDSVIVNNVLVSLEQKQVSGFADSVYIIGSSGTTVTVGDDVSDAADSGRAPVKVGGVARGTNPGKVSDGDRVSASMDLVGRQLMRPLQVRGLMATAYVQVSTGTETTLLAGVAGAYLDLVYILLSNNSDAAVSVDIRAVTAGNKQLTIQVPANGVAGVSLPVPILQDETGNNWTIDLPDITGTTISASALFTKEV